jgi:hypothetical protein
MRYSTNLSIGTERMSRRALPAKTAMQSTAAMIQSLAFASLCGALRTNFEIDKDTDHSTALNGY